MKKDFSEIKLFAMDVDGTLTDGKIYIGNDGEVMKAFNAKDGLGIKLLIKKGIVPIIITGRRSKIVTRRCEEIGITVLYQGVRDKADILKNVMAKYDCTPEQTVYIGDDMNDLSAMQRSSAFGVFLFLSCILCHHLSNSRHCAAALLPYVDFVLTQKSGDAPVREAIDIILENRLTLSDYESI